MTNPIEIERTKDDDGINLCVCIRPYVGHATSVFISKRENGDGRTDGIPRLYFSSVLLHRPVTIYPEEGIPCQFLDGGICSAEDCSDRLDWYLSRRNYDIKVSDVSDLVAGLLSTFIFLDLMRSNYRIEEVFRIENDGYSDSELKEQLLINLRWLLKE